MKKNNRVPKGLLIQMLDILGLTMRRVTFMDRRMWKVSDGSYYPSLQAIFKRYKKPNDKATFNKIESIVKKIERAI